MIRLIAEGLKEGGANGVRSRMYRASWYWTFNIYGAVVGGLGGGVVMVVLAIMVLLSDGASPQARLVSFFMLASAIGGFLFLYPGNAAAGVPVAVEVGRSGLRLFAPFKEIFIPWNEIGTIHERFFSLTFVVHLRRRHVLLTSFVINWFFGPERHALAEAIRKAIEQHQATSLSVGRRE